MHHFAWSNKDATMYKHKKCIHVPTPTRSPAFTLNVNFFSVKGRPFRYLQTNKTETRSVSNINRSNDKYQCHSHRDPSPSFPSTDAIVGTVIVGAVLGVTRTPHMQHHTEFTYR